MAKKTIAQLEKEIDERFKRHHEIANNITKALRSMQDELEEKIEKKGATIADEIIKKLEPMMKTGVVDNKFVIDMPTFDLILRGVKILFKIAMVIMGLFILRIDQVQDILATIINKFL